MIERISVLYIEHTFFASVKDFSVQCTIEKPLGKLFKNGRKK